MIEFENEVRRLKIAQDKKRRESLVFNTLKSLARENNQLTDCELDNIGDKALEWFKALQDEIEGKDMSDTERMWCINSAKTKVLSDLCQEDNSYCDKKAFKVSLLLLEAFY